jgi:hypothetical protein
MGMGGATLVDRLAIGVVTVVVLLSPMLFDLVSALTR